MKALLRLLKTTIAYASFYKSPPSQLPLMRDLPLTLMLQ